MAVEIGEPSEEEQERVIQGFLSPYPVGFNRWASRLLVRQERGGYGPWVELPWHAGYDARILAAGRRVNKWLYMLKSRKRGWSLKNTAMLVYRAMYMPHSSSIAVTWHEDAAYGKRDSIQERMGVMYGSLPLWERRWTPAVKCPEGEFGVRGELVLAQHWHGGVETFGHIKIGTASPNIGAQADYNFAFLDEIERWQQPDQTVSSVEGSVARSGGVMVAGSTLTLVSHPGSYLWRNLELARRGEIDAEWMFVGFGSRPDDNEAAWEQKRRDAEAKGELVLFYRDNCRTLEEALMATGTGLADPESLAACNEGRRPLPLPPSLAEWAGVA